MTVKQHQSINGKSTAESINDELIKLLNLNKKRKSALKKIFEKIPIAKYSEPNR